MKYLLILSVCVTSALCFNFNLETVDEIQKNGSNGTYFGYTVLLQKGTVDLRPIVIVGAPGQGSSRTGGSVYSCIKEGVCNKYNIAASNAHTPNGNFLGSALDGGDHVGDLFVTCASRVVKAVSDSNYLPGVCYLKRNSSDLGRGYDSEIKPLDDQRAISGVGTLYYDYAFAQAGFDVQYMQDDGTLLFGAPGVKNWNGALAVAKYKDIQIIPKQSAPIFKDNFGYTGYKVMTGRLDSGRKNIWYLVGSPRANDLFGNVKIYNSLGTLAVTLTGDEIGSYYGSSVLAVDLNNDRVDDILVGAPTGAGHTFDEGYVYSYVTVQAKPKLSIKLFGNKKPGARFGSSIVSLGDIDLDSYNDVAISAPFEDDGVGAVYIYMGSRTGIQPIYSQRLSPLDFPGNLRNVRGFGQGISKGVDIDDNGHNDLAIGAYQSSQVFVIRTQSIIDYKLILEPNVTSISSNGMNIKFCIHYSQRSPKGNLKNTEFKLKLQLDYRVNGETNFDYDLNVTLEKSYCKSLDVEIKTTSLDMSPFKMSLKSSIVRNDIIGKGEGVIEKSIPYSHGCGDDNICQTALLVQAFSSLENIVLGLNKEFTVTISAENSGEPAYGCELFLNFSNVIELRNTRDCNLENGTYICPFFSKLDTITKEVPFIFDINLTKPKMNEVKLNYELKCLGVNTLDDTNKGELQVKVLLKNSPYIQGSSTPANFYFTDENLGKGVDVSHTFKIGNTGPSPVKLDVFLVLPTIKHDDIDIFQFNAKGSLNGVEMQCQPIKANTSLQLNREFDVSNLLTEPLNKTIVIDCLEENVDCLTLFCDGDYLYKSTEIAEYNMKITTNTKLLASHFKTELLKKDILAFVSSAYLFNSTTSVESHATTMIFASKSKPVPLWVYILAGILGVILLALLIFLLYKCHFFDRNYRDKLNDERLMDQKIEENTDNMEPVDLANTPNSN